MRKSIKAIGTIGAMTILLCGIYWFVTTYITTVTKNIHVGKTFKSISIDIKELKSETEHIIDMEQVIDFKVNDSGLMLYEYSDAKVHPFRKFRAPFSGKAEHTFPE